MSTPFLGEIRMFGGNFAPVGWAFCDGRLMPISENDALFNLIGTTYGGDGQETFALPDLQGRVPLHQGPAFTLGESGGVESVTLTATQIPTHTHSLMASGDPGNQVNPDGALTSNSQGALIYIDDAPTLNMSVQAISVVGGSQPHENMQPFLCISFIIALFGIFPSQT